ncbi:MAG: serine/threonine protein kinase [Planctomycetes bacterium]|nr:serine/threonine protein kinase [Planctomycetota bacterium]
MNDEILDRYRFRLVRKIAEGGMGCVWEALQYGVEGFTKKMAVKTINEKMSSDAEFVEMFVGEAKLVANLVHENIVQIYQLGRLEGQFYIAMEYISGVNLQEVMDAHSRKSKKPPVELATFVISRVCRSLNYAHTKKDEYGKLLGVVHRDVSPKNIMINFEGLVKLTDFGIAKAANYMRNREGDILLGKTQYMSPEQAAFKETDPRSDLFSLGICMFELLTGECLFQDDDTLVILDKVQHEKLPAIRNFVSDIPKEVERILYKALERELDRRYQSAAEMLSDLEHFMYDKGYGPTNQVLEKYMRELFPDRVRF